MNYAINYGHYFSKDNNGFAGCFNEEVNKLVELIIIDITRLRHFIEWCKVLDMIFNA